MLERPRLTAARWRGAGPIQWSLLEGDQETGVGVMAMEEGLDTGPVLLERNLPIGLLDNAQQVGERLHADRRTDGGGHASDRSCRPRS